MDAKYLSPPIQNFAAVDRQNFWQLPRQLQKRQKEQAVAGEDLWHPLRTSAQGDRMGTISFRIYPNLKLAHFQGLGDVSHDMLISEIRQLHIHPDWSFNFNTFIDFEKAVIKNETESFAQYQKYFGDLQETVPVRKWAIFTCQRTPHKVFDFNRLPNLRNIIIDVFQTRDEALKFLNVEPHQLADQVAT